MSLERVVAAPFQGAGSDRLGEQAFVVALSLHRDWFSPAQAKRIIELASAEGMLARAEDGSLRPTFDVRDVAVPPDFAPTEDVLVRRSTFETMLARIVEAGHDKREAVSAINRLQRDMGLTVEAAAALYASEHDIDLAAEIDRAIEALRATAETG